MIREIILVEVVNQDDMSTDKSKAFTKTEKAEEYFKKILREDIHLIDDGIIGPVRLILFLGSAGQKTCCSSNGKQCFFHILFPTPVLPGSG